MWQFTLFTTIIVGTCCAITALLIEDATIFGESNTSLLGWMSHRWRWIEIVFAFIIGVVSLTGFNYACKFIPALIYSALQLIDPALCGILAWRSGVESAPDWLTCVGGVIVIIGVGLITVAGHIKSGSGH